MIIIAFSNKTSKILPKIFCRKFKHCAPIVANNNGQLIMYQFVRRGNIVQIKIRMRDIKILGQYGWKFIYMPCALPYGFDGQGIRTCVGLCKRAIGIKNATIQTPDALHKYLGAAT